MKAGFYTETVSQDIYSFIPNRFFCGPQIRYMTANATLPEAYRAQQLTLSISLTHETVENFYATPSSVRDKKY